MLYVWLKSYNTFKSLTGFVLALRDRGQVGGVGLSWQPCNSCCVHVETQGYFNIVYKQF